MIRIAFRSRRDRYELEPRADALFIEDNPGVAVSRIAEASLTSKLGISRRFGEHHSAFLQYARGFRAPPYNDVNIGFTNLAFGYTAIANPHLEAETSNGYELGWRSALAAGNLAVSGFYNDYDDFIESLASIGVRDGLQVFQSATSHRRASTAWSCAVSSICPPRSVPQMDLHCARASPGRKATIALPAGR